MTKKEIKKVLNELTKDNDKIIFSFKDTNGNNIGKVKVPIDSTNEEIEKSIKNYLTNKTLKQNWKKEKKNKPKGLFFYYVWNFVN